VRIAVLVPTHDYAPALFAYDLAQMQAHTVASFGEGAEVGLYFEVGTYVHQARESLLRQAVADGAHYALFLDSDMRFPPDTFVRLLDHGKPFVGINYSRREFPPTFTAAKAGELLVTSRESRGLEKVDSIGFGACLIETAILGRLPADRPWFWFDRTEAGDDIGEDVYFCGLLKDAGAPPFVDHDLSRACGHIGNFTFLCAHAEAHHEDTQ
jgi:hypothetical protein